MGESCRYAFEGQRVATVERGVKGIGGDGEIAGACGAEDDQFVEGVYVHGVRHVGKPSSEICGEEALCARGVEFEDADVGIAVGGAVVGSE